MEHCLWVHAPAHNPDTMLTCLACANLLQQMRLPTRVFVSQVGYHLGVHAPGHKHPTDYWRAGHNVLLAHAAAVQIFRQAVPDGKVGIVANSDFFEPLTSSAADQVCWAWVIVFVIQ